MTQFSIFERESAAAAAPVAVAERFSWLAFLLPPVFGALHGLWLELLAYVLAVALLAMAGFWLGAAAAIWLYLLLAALIGLEAPALRRGALRRRGWVHRSELFAPDEAIAAVHWLQAGRIAG